MLKELRNKTSEFISSCPPKLAVLWFWVTMATTTYFGICHVLPTIYTPHDHQEWLLTLTRAVGIILFIEMAVNWICLRFVTSRYQPSDEACEVSMKDIGGFQIDLDQLRTRSAEGSKGRETYSLPLTSIRPIGVSPCNRWNHDTMYLVSLHADEACFVTSSKFLQLKSSIQTNDWFDDGREFKRVKRSAADDDDDDDDGGDDLSFVSSSSYSGTCYHSNEHPTNGSTNNTTNKRPNFGMKNNNVYINKERRLISREDRDFNNSENEDPEEGRHVVVYPYWSWKPCRSCNVIRPPRAHHCRICGHCVLKRDHHCFFVSSCVGLRNQRHFVVFLFWSSVSIVFSLLQSAVYILVTCFYSTNVGTIQCLSNTILPVTIYRTIGGNTGTFDLVLVLVLYSLIWFLLVCLGFLVEQVRLIVYNCTSFERENNILVVRRNRGHAGHTKLPNYDLTSDTLAFKSLPNVKISDIDDRSIWGGKMKRWNRNLFWVFGKNWILNFLVPLHFVFATPEDGITWRSIES